jgi:maleate cis-trans isomerase
VPEKIRLGFIVPSLNVIAEDNFIRLAQAWSDHQSPPDQPLGVHFTRADVDGLLPLEVQFQGMVDNAPSLGKSLASAGVSVVAFACTSASLFKGPGFDRAIAQAITQQTGLPSVCTASAVLQALEALGVKRVAVATPYVEWVYAAERDFLEAGGFEVTAINGLGRQGGKDISRISSQEIFELADDVMDDKAEALFISCTDLPSLELITRLEEKYARPVITSNQATFWRCAQILGLGPVPGYGQLMVDN